MQPIIINSITVTIVVPAKTRFNCICLMYCGPCIRADVFPAHHSMEARYCDRNVFRLSVRLSVTLVIDA